MKGKKRKTILAGLFITGAILAGCSEPQKEALKDADKLQETVQEDVKDFKEKVDEINKETADKETKAEPKEGFSEFGKEGYGYVNLPENFVELVQPYGDIIAYTNVSQTFIVNMMSYGKIDINDAKTALEGVLSESGMTSKAKEVTVNGNDALEFYSFTESANHHLYVYLVDVDGVINYLAVEHIGDDTDKLRTQILDSYNF